MRTSTLRRYSCSNSSSSVFRGRVRDRVLAATSRSGSVTAGAVVSVLMSPVAICASGCDIAFPRHAARRLVRPLRRRAGGRPLDLRDLRPAGTVLLLLPETAVHRLDLPGVPRLHLVIGRRLAMEHTSGD